MGVHVELSVDDSHVLVRPTAEVDAPTVVNVKLIPEQTLISETVPASGVPIHTGKAIIFTI